MLFFLFIVEQSWRKISIKTDVRTMLLGNLESETFINITFQRKYSLRFK